MTAYVVYLEQITGLMKKWTQEYALYVPVRLSEGFFDFKPWKDNLEIAWDYDLAYNNLKRFFFPPKEDMISFDIEACTSKPVYSTPKQILFGVHPYDLRAINQLDQLMEAGSPDPYYLGRREETVIFAMEAQRIAKTAFWGSMGTEKADLGFDLYWTKIGPAAFFVEVGSARGEELLLAKGGLQKATLAERESVRRIKARVQNMAKANGLKFPWQEIPKLLSRNWNSPLWREKAEKCLSCGSCNLVCPTCYCFDIREEVDDGLKKGVRSRFWDGCMLESFAKVAGNHNFRGLPLERYRHRYFRKGKYIYDIIGELGCVGCGRCVLACTAKIANPMATYNRLWEVEQNEI